MKLELGYIQINDIQFSKECKVENSTLFVDPDAVKAFMYEDDDVKAWVKDFSFDVAKPGESVRITPVKDVIEPRVKVEGPGGVFPGVISKVDTVGSGKTHVLTRHGRGHRRQDRWLPGGHHRHDRSRRRVHSVLQAQQPVVVVAEPAEGYQDHARV